MAKNVATGIYLVGRQHRAQAPKFKGCNSNERQNFDNLDDAVRWRGAALAANEAGLPIPDASLFRSSAPGASTEPTPQVRLVSEGVESYWDWFESERGDEVGYRYLRTTRKTLDNYVIEMLGDRDIAEVTEDDAAKVRDALRDRGLSITTSKAILKQFSFVFRHAKHHGFVQMNPFKYVKAKQPPRAKQLNKWAGKDTPYQSLADTRRVADRLGGVFSAVVWLQRLCALRIGEALGITLGDINWATGWLTIRGQGGKMFRERDDNGDFIAVDRTTELKSEAAKREIVIPKILLLALRKLVIEVYGVDPIDGDFDESAPLLVAKAGSLPRLRGYYLAYPKVRSALGMDPDEVGYKRTGHDDREFANTDLARDKVVVELIRGQFMGHEPEAEPGASKTNAKFYLGYREYEPEMQTIADYFDAQVRSQLGDDVQLVGDLGARTLEGDGFTMAEFCQLSGIPRSTAWAYVDRGEIPCERHSLGEGRQPQIFIRAEHAYDFLDKCNDVWTVGRAAQRFKVPSDAIIYWLNSGQVDGAKFGKHWLIEIDSLKKRIADRQRFVGNGISRSQAGRLLNSPASGIDHLVKSGALISAGADACGNDRVTRESVMKYRKKLLASRGCERLENGRLGRRQHGDPYAYRRRHVVKSAKTDQ